MPEPDRWWARLVVMLTTAALAAEYSTMFGSGVVAARLPMLTTLPQPRSRMCGSTARIMRTAVTTFPFTASSQSAGSALSQSCSANGPALLTSTSTPQVRARSATAAAVSSAVRSPSTTSATAPAALSSSATAPARAASRPCTSTAQPSPASCRATAAPMPPLLAVMRARRPVRSRSMGGDDRA